MRKSVGKALEKAIITKEEGSSGKEPQKDTKSEFFNRNRQEIFQYLCSHPCSHMSSISKASGLSLHTTNWHLRRLHEGGYISKRTIGNKTVFYPTDMININDIPILEVLNNEKAKAIYNVILEKSGLSQREICEILGLKHQAVIWYTRKLETLMLITSIEDGKYRRYYPTDLLLHKKDENIKRMKIFKDNILKKFKKEMLSPTILRSTKEKTVVRIARGRSKSVITLNIDPFITVLS
jgi:predicted transcriptional regulator